MWFIQIGETCLQYVIIYVYIKLLCTYIHTYKYSTYKHRYDAIYYIYIWFTWFTSDRQMVVESESQGATGFWNAFFVGAEASSILLILRKLVVNYFWPPTGVLLGYSSKLGQQGEKAQLYKCIYIVRIGRCFFFRSILFFRWFGGVWSCPTSSYTVHHYM